LVDAALAAYGSLALLCAAAVIVGQAILSLCGRREFAWVSAPIGVAAILVASGIAIKLPGHATAVAIAVAVLVAGGIAVLALRGGARGFGAALASGLPAAGLAVLIGSIPFIVNWRVGILGVGLVNDDMASHLLIADWLGTRVGDMPVLIHQGYPVGPHALAAGIDGGLGTGLIAAFAAITLTSAALTALVAVDALWPLRRWPRIVAAALVALPYLAAAYLAQEAFKEPMEALFVLSFAVLLPAARSPAGAIPLGVIAAGAVYAYSFPGLFWLAGTAVIWALVEWSGAGHRIGWAGAAGSGPATFSGMSSVSRRRDISSGRRSGYRRPLLVMGAAFLVLLVLTAPEWSRMVDFSHFRAFRHSALSSGLGNLRHQVSPLEALGIWPASDFRLSASDATAPVAAFYLGGLIAALALAVGLPRWIRRHGSAVPSALAAAIVIYVGARLFGTVYTSAKALAIAAPLITLISFGGLLDPDRVGLGRGTSGAGPANIRSRDARTVRSMDAKRSLGAHPAVSYRTLLALALGAGILLSSFLVLRQAPVAPREHAAELAELRPLVEGRDVLFLGRDNFLAYDLRGARPFTAVRNFYDPNYVKPDLRLANVFQKFDFDSVRPATLRRFRYVITTRAAYASGPPPGFRPLAATPTFQLWRRVGPVGPRKTLPEGASPGALLHCGTPAGRRIKRSGGVATLFARPPVVGANWSPSSTVDSGAPVRQTLRVAAGSWEVSLQYDATRTVHVTAPGFTGTLPGNLDYRGSVPFYPVGRLRLAKPGPVTFTVSVERPPLPGRLLGAKSEAHLGALAVSPGGASPRPDPGEDERKAPLARACKRYVDWYRPARTP
jgi:hypothetical protein